MLNLLNNLLLVMLAAIASNAFAETIPAPLPQGGTTPAIAPIPKTDFDLVGEVRSREPTSEDIGQIKTIWEEMRRAQEKPAGDQPRPVISMVNLDLSPGSTPPLVRISNQTGAILLFMDSSGKRWAIDHVTNLSDNAIETQDKPFDQTKDQSSIFVKAKRFGATGNVAVYLRGFDTPIIITLLAGQKDVDYRVDFRVPANINGQSTSISPDRQEFDARLTSAIMGITPTECGALSSDSREVSAWQCRDGIIIRSGGILLSPATIDGKKIVGSDGTRAYLIPDTPVVSMMSGGKSIVVTLGKGSK